MVVARTLSPNTCPHSLDYAPMALPTSTPPNLLGLMRFKQGPLVVR